METQRACDPRRETVASSIWGSVRAAATRSKFGCTLFRCCSWGHWAMNEDPGQAAATPPSPGSPIHNAGGLGAATMEAARCRAAEDEVRAYDSAAVYRLASGT
ncbi:hypothetical protein HPB50_000270 [Hyalomma asiaticum]|uniref:Uncharacterized protein n=1 Tax=Hyalomma asiaticum TaxID=266040 RepID=A0ACB7S3V7_HYAAI|nr:hypothetical protein HPB50_000270 [Hyalomma asiaticum]